LTSASASPFSLYGTNAHLHAAGVVVESVTQLVDDEGNGIASCQVYRAGRAAPEVRGTFSVLVVGRIHELGSNLAVEVHHAKGIITIGVRLKIGGFVDHEEELRAVKTQARPVSPGMGIVF
jgi:hypothetical protein